MTEYQVVPATEKHAQELSVTMRADDVREAWAAGHVSPLEALMISIETAPDARAGLADGRVVCIFGVSQWTVLGLAGIPWLLAAEEMPRHARHFLRANKAYIAEIRERYMTLANRVDARNKKAVLWLRWLGFKIDPALPFGFDQLPFHRFHWEAA